MLSELRKSSPTGHNSNTQGPPDHRNRHSSLSGADSMARIGQDSMGRAANAMMQDYSRGVPEYGSSIQKVMPKSRD